MQLSGDENLLMLTKTTSKELNKQTFERTFWMEMKGYQLPYTFA